MRSLHVLRADLARFPTDVVVLPTRGGFEGEGVAAKVADALEARCQVDLRSLARATIGASGVPLGESRLLPRPAVAADRGGACPRVVCVHARADADPEATKRAIRDGLAHALREASRAVEAATGTIAVPAIGVGVGGTRPRDAAHAMRPSIVAWLDEPGDERLCLVTWEPATHRAFLDVFADRIEQDAACCVSEAGFPNARPSRAALDRLNRTLQASRSVLFIGSGLSRNAVPGKPTWEALFDSEWLPAKSFDRSLLPDFAQIAVDNAGRGPVEARFVERVGGDSLPSTAHYALLSLPWGAIITTNYDDLIERTLGALRTRFVVVTHDEQVVDLDEHNAVPVVKIHGGLCCPRCPYHAGANPQKPLASRLVATRDDYDRFFEQHPAIAAYLEAKLLTARGVIVGYGINDPHLRGLFARVGGVRGRAGEPRLTCVSTDPSPVEAYWQQRGLETIVVPLDPEGHARNYLDFVDAACSRAWRGIYNRQLPEEYLAELPAASVKSLPREARRRLVTSLVEAGCRLPAALASMADLDSLRRHASPELAGWLEASGVVASGALT